MAITWGGYLGHLRVGLDFWISPGSVSTSTAHVTVTAVIYIQPQPGSSHAYNGTMWYSGDRAGSVGYSINQWNTTNVQEIARIPYTIATSYAGAVSAYMAASTIVVWNGGRPGVTRNQTIGRRPYRAPRAPLNVKAVRNTDARATVTWSTNYDSASGAQPWTNVSIDRWSKSTGKWTRVATVGWSVTSWSDTGIKANDEYKYRVRSNNTAGSSGWVTTGSVYTTPAAATNVTAEKVGANIVVRWKDNSRYNTGFDIYDNGTLVGSAGANATSYTHSSPSTTTTHQYHIVTKAGALRSAASSKSNVVQLLAKPNPPANLKPNGPQGIMLGDSVVFSWQHNPVDSSAQRQYEIEVRKLGGAWRSLGVKTSSAQTVTIPAADATPEVGDFEWRVRTWGSFTTGSDFSNVATYKVSTAPTITINSPLPDTTLISSVATLTWGYQQDEGQGQVAIEVTLIDTTTGADTVAYAGRIETSATTLTLPYALSDASTYTLLIRAQSSTGLWSEVDHTNVIVAYAKPLPPVVAADFNPENGDIVVDISNPGETRPELTVTHNKVWRNINDDTVWNRLQGQSLPVPALNSYKYPSFEYAREQYSVLRTNRIETPKYRAAAMDEASRGEYPTPDGITAYGNWRLGDVSNDIDVWDDRDGQQSMSDDYIYLMMMPWNNIPGNIPLIRESQARPASPGSTWSGSWTINVWHTDNYMQPGEFVLGVYWLMSNGELVFASPTNQPSARAAARVEEMDPGVSERLVFNGLVAPPGTTAVMMGLQFDTSAGNGVVGWSMMGGLYDDAHLENVPYLSGPGFTGDTPAESDVEYEWMGEPNKSASQQVINLGATIMNAMAINAVPAPELSKAPDGHYSYDRWVYMKTKKPDEKMMQLGILRELAPGDLIFHPSEDMGLMLPTPTVVGQELPMSVALTVSIVEPYASPVRLALQLPGGYTGETVVVSPGQRYTLYVDGTGVAEYADSRGYLKVGLVLTDELSDPDVTLNIHDSFSVYNAYGRMPVAVGSMTGIGPGGDFNSNWLGAPGTTPTYIYAIRPEGVGESSLGPQGQRYALSWRTARDVYEGGYSLATMSHGRAPGEAPIPPHANSYDWTPIDFPKFENLVEGDVITVTFMVRRMPGIAPAPLGSMVINNADTSRPQGQRIVGYFFEDARELSTEWTQYTLSFPVDPRVIAANNETAPYRGLTLLLAGGTAIDAPVLYDLATFVHAKEAYTGIPFSGDTSGVDPSGFVTEAEWTDVAHQSTSRYTYAWPGFVESEWELVADNVPPNTAITDREGRTWGPTVYLVQSFTGVPSMNQSIDIVRADSYYAWFNTGTDYAQFFAIPYNVTIDEDIEVANQKTYIFDGRHKPVVLSGDGVERSFSVRGTLDPQDVRGSEYTDVSSVAEMPGVYLYRDHDGRRLYVTVQGVSIDRETRHLREVTVKILEVDGAK